MGKHVHSELIKQWADGAEIEYFCKFGGWVTVETPTWNPELKYRMKQEPPKRIFKYMFVELNPCLDNAYNKPNIQIEFDPITEKLLEVNVWDADEKQWTTSLKKNLG